MIIVLSPAKSLDETPLGDVPFTKPLFQTDANKLVRHLKSYASEDLQQLMGISENLAIENVRRFKKYRARPSDIIGKRAINTFAGDVYRGLNVQDFSEADYAFAQDHLRILSGLYGLLRPMDLMQPYRLEMGTKLDNERGKNLYQFWGKKISREVNKSLKAVSSKTLINLASEEYFKSIKNKYLKADVLTLNFKEYKDGELKFISFTAKVARGMMARYIIKNKINDIEDIKGFNDEGYHFSEENSTDNTWLFVR